MIPTELNNQSLAIDFKIKHMKTKFMHTTEPYIGEEQWNQRGELVCLFRTEGKYALGHVCGNLMENKKGFNMIKDVLTQGKAGQDSIC